MTDQWDSGGQEPVPGHDKACAVLAIGATWTGAGLVADLHHGLRHFAAGDTAWFAVFLAAFALVSFWPASAARRVTAARSSAARTAARLAGRWRGSRTASRRGGR